MHIGLIFLMEPYITVIFSSQEDDESPLNLSTHMVGGHRHYKFKLSAWYQKGGEWHLYILSVQNSEKHKGRLLYFPLWALPWLREQIVTILVKHDGTQRIDEMPAIPEWAKQGFSNFKTTASSKPLRKCANSLIKQDRD
jgi:hypothetical protein